jgi:hypothetical protein
MARRALSLPVDDNSTKDPAKHKEHGTNVRALIGAEGMRVIGKVHDLGIIVPDKDEA